VSRRRSSDRRSRRGTDHFHPSGASHWDDGCYSDFSRSLSLKATTFMSIPAQPPRPKTFKPLPRARTASAMGPRSTASMWPAGTRSRPDRPFQLGDRWNGKKVETLLPIVLPHSAQVDVSYVQLDFSWLAGGGTQTPLKPGAVPAGLFVAVRAHPVYKVTALKFPVTPLPFPFSPRLNPAKVAVKPVQIEAEFLATPNMGA